MSFVEVSNLTKRWGDVTAVDNVSFSIDEGSFLTLLGPSGCGKTTILRMIAGLETPTQGEIRIGENIVFSTEKGINLPARERKLGLVFQSYALWPHMTVFENIAYGLRVKKMTEKNIKAKVAEALDYMKLYNMAERYPQEMSGGQQQRVALARMLASEPALFLMDEPLSNLDAKLRMEMRAEIKNIHAYVKATTLYVTHDQDEGLTMATEIAILNSGQIEHMDRPKKVYHYPDTMFVADFIGSPPINIFEAEADAGVAGKAAKITLPTGEVLKTEYNGLEAGGKVYSAIRPEKITINSEKTDNQLTAIVNTVLPSGSETIIQAKVGEDIFNILMQQDVEFEVGEEVKLHIPPGSILLYGEDKRLIPA
ncbi:MAG: ABC transporter ATP-binding protein [Spirochaetales bacterium]|nr:ABC transporter ATP-binding protein [Spirochaetales bacterium]